MTRSIRAGVAFSFTAALASVASGQAALSTQGFGFPTGQLSSRAWGTGGAIAEVDPLSPVNPATLAMIGTRLVNFQIEPEYRSVSSSGGIDRTTTYRLLQTLEQEGFVARTSDDYYGLTIAVRELSGPQASGYYFSVTDKMWKAGSEEYHYMTQGALVVGGTVAVNFLFLSNTAPGPDLDAALDLLRSARNAP